MERVAWLGLSAVPGLGPQKMQAVVKRMGSAGEVMRDPAKAWGRMGWSRPPAPSAAAMEQTGRQQLEQAEALGATTLLLGQSDYPREFQDLEQPPPVLHVLGRVELLTESHSRIAVVGARSCTPYGRRQAGRFGAGLAFGGEVVVSGAARGIDQAAMAAALESQGDVIAVVGSGLDNPYPKDAWPLLENLLAQGGAIVSEFPFGQEPRPGNFPRRNRLIAAISRAVLVIQATKKSGTMNTVGWALKIGKEVFALPGPVDDLASSGTNTLLHEGAGVAMTPAGMLADLRNDDLMGLTGDGAVVMEALRDGDAHPSDLARSTDMPEDLVRMQLVDLELRGLVTRVPSGLYHRCGPQVP